MLGGFTVSVGDKTISEDDWRLRKAASVVKLLALAPGHRLHGEQIMDALWPDLGRSAANNNLRRTLHSARRVLEPTPATSCRYLFRKAEHLILGPGERTWVDVEAFEDAASVARRNREPAAYRAAIDLYAGDLLPGDRYEDWAEVRRRQLRRTFLSLLVELAKLHEVRGEYSAAVEVLARAVAEDPTREEAHVALIRAHALSGDVEEALAQYERLEVVLSQKLDARPRTSSRLLRDEITIGRFPPREPESTTRNNRQATETSDGSKHNLPTPRTSFVGREQEVIAIKRELSMTHLLTFTGAGGSGKTRLALEVARDLVGAYPHGVWLVELAPLSEGALVPQALATVIGVQERAGQPLGQTLVEVLQSRATLLVLDNCEHLVETAASLANSLLDACPDLRVLATSREALGVPGEVRWALPALSTPDPGRSPTPGELETYESVRLFAERARHRESTFALTASNARPVAEICLRLDGIPLAVELAAARVGTLGVAQISERLVDSLKLLTAGGRTATPRQRTLRGALDWSHDLLSEEETRLFRPLSEFAGGWTIKAAEVVCSGNGIDEREVLDLLSGLADKSLLVTRTGDDGAMRYRFLEPVRQYAGERLEESGETEDIRRRHAGYFLALAEEAEPQLRRREQAAWLGRLDSELDNIRAALFWALERADYELVSRASGALLFFWSWRGYLREGCRWLEAGLTSGITPSVQAKALNGLADLEVMLGEYDRSAALLDESLALYRAEGDENGIASCLYDLGWLIMFRGDNQKARELLEESISRGRAGGDDLRVAFALNRLSSIAMADLDYATATALLEESLALYREAGDGRSEAMCLGMLGGIAILQGELRRATDLLEEAIAQLRRVVSAVDAFYPCCLAIAATLRSQHDRAAALLEEGFLLGQTSGNRLHTLQCVEAAMMLAADLAQAEKAARLWGAAEASREAIGAPLQPVDREFYGPYLAAARTMLGEEAWSAAQRRGRTMTLDGAVEYAMTTWASSPHGSPHDSRPPVVLTRREREVAALVARGLSNARIASGLHISERTAENHVANILKKLGLRSRDQVSDHLGEP